MKAKLSTDGGARGNPGPAAYGYVLEAEDGSVIDARGEKIGVATNNVAEYRALIAGLEAALSHGVTELDVVSDSELLVKQMRGEYKVKNEALRGLSLEAARIARRIGAQRAGGHARQRGVGRLIRLPARREPQDEPADASGRKRGGAVAGEHAYVLLCQSPPKLRVHQLHDLPLRRFFRDRKTSSRIT